MPSRMIQIPDSNSINFITLTCIQWLNLFYIANAWASVYKWFDYLHTKGNRITGYVIMPNHLHALIYFSNAAQSLNSIIGNGKRFMAYEIIDKLKQAGDLNLLNYLHGLVKLNESKKGQIHKVFEDGFEAKECYSRKFMLQKLNYIHHNPVSKKWNLVDNFIDYKHSSAGFYENGESGYDKLLHIGEVW